MSDPLTDAMQHAALLARMKGIDSTEALQAEHQVQNLRKALGQAQLDPLQKAWSATSRQAAAEARSHGGNFTHATATRPQEVLHPGRQWSHAGSPSASDETNAKLDSTDRDQADKYNKMMSAAGDPEAYKEHQQNWSKAVEAHQKAHGEAMRSDPGYARDAMEHHLVGNRGVELDKEGEAGGKGFMDFKDKLYGATGHMEPSGGASGMKVTMTGKDGEKVSAGGLKQARLKLKRSYYGAADPNKTLKEQGMPTFHEGSGVGRNVTAPSYDRG